MPHDRLLDDLMAAATFEDAAAVVLRAMLAEAEATLAESVFAARGQILRGVVYLHPGDSYQRLFGVEQTGARVEGVGYLASAGVWRWVAEHRCSVSIDVRLEAIRPWLPDGPLKPISDERG